MKKKIFSIIGVAAFAVVVAFNINASISNGSDNDVTLANVESLVLGENLSGVVIACHRSCSGNSYCWKRNMSSWKCEFSGNMGNICYCP